MSRQPVSTRQLLRVASIRAFAERGFHGTTTRRVTEAAGLSPAALYVHHRSKEDLLFDIAFDGHTEILEIVRRAAASTSAPGPRLSAVVYAFVLWHAQESRRSRVINYELRCLDAEHLHTIHGLRNQIHALIVDVVRSVAATAGDSATPDPVMAATAIESLGIDLARWYSDSVDRVPEVIAERYVAMAHRIVGNAEGS